MRAVIFIRYLSLSGDAAFLRFHEGELDDVRDLARSIGRRARVAYRRPDGVWELLRPQARAGRISVPVQEESGT